MTRLHMSLKLARRLVGGPSGRQVGRLLTPLRAAALVAVAASVLLSAAAGAAIGNGNSNDSNAGFLIAQAGTAGNQLPAGDQWVGRQSAEQDLVWLLAGIMDMERDKKLALTRDQATSIWPTFKSLVDKGLIRLEVDPAQFEIGNRPGWQGQGQSQSQSQSQSQGQAGQGAVQRDHARIRELRKQREAREQALRQAIEKIENVLSAKQIAYVDNFDFDPAKYGLTSRAEGGRPRAGDGASGAGQGTPPTQEDIKRFMEAAKQNAQKLADFYKKFQAFIQKKAGIKA
ncbi:MAG: hypothetical protein GX492_05545 [Firmicutes bacterium]|nr:hypothetical protein [Bacillota bacterium]